MEVKMKRMIMIMNVLVFVMIIVMVSSGTIAWSQPQANPGAKKTGKPMIQMAILLDTSNSMDGLIDQAKSQLWKIVNELALAKKDGQSPQLEVALYEYGNDSLPASEGHIRLVVPLSTDLDKISDELFKLKTNGGNEYCGQVIGNAIRQLQWSKNNDYFKVIFIAGNEPFTQGGTDYKNTCKESISKGIIVNTIFCGDLQEGIQTSWKDGALRADGKYMNIDQNQKIVEIEAPQDKEIITLGEKLNETYIAYGKKGMEKKEMQAEQDSNAASVGAGSSVQRSVAKASSNYVNTAWDLVDAEKEGSVKVEELKDDELPAEMKKMSKAERKAYVDKKMKERKTIQDKISNLRKERDKYVIQKQKQMAASGLNTLDAVIIKAIRDQAEQKKYAFEKK